MGQQPVEIILLRQWASYISLPVWVMDADGTLVFYNEAAEVLLGRTFSDAGPISLPELDRIFNTVTPDGRPMTADELPIGIALLQHRPAHGRVRFEGLDRVARTIDVTAFPIEGQAGRHLGAVAMFWEPDP
jgi:PAS domain-containing protein